MELDEQLQQLILVDGATYTQLELYNEVSLLIKNATSTTTTRSKRSWWWWCCCCCCFRARCLRGTCKTSLFCFLLMTSLVFVVYMVSLFSKKA